MEVKLEVKTFDIDYLCPKCNAGYYRPFGHPDGRMNEHACNNPACCHRETIEDKVYPIRVVERVLVHPNKTT